MPIERIARNVHIDSGIVRTATLAGEILLSIKLAASLSSCNGTTENLVLSEQMDAQMKSNIPLGFYETTNYHRQTDPNGIKQNEQRLGTFEASYAIVGYDFSSGDQPAPLSIEMYNYQNNSVVVFYDEKGAPGAPGTSYIVNAGYENNNGKPSLVYSAMTENENGQPATLEFMKLDLDYTDPNINGLITKANQGDQQAIDQLTSLFSDPHHPLTATLNNLSTGAEMTTDVYSVVTGEAPTPESNGLDKLVAIITGAHSAKAAENPPAVASAIPSPTPTPTLTATPDAVATKQAEQAEFEAKKAEALKMVSATLEKPEDFANIPIITAKDYDSGIVRENMHWLIDNHLPPSDNKLPDSFGTNCNDATGYCLLDYNKIDDKNKNYRGIGLFFVKQDDGKTMLKIGLEYGGKNELIFINFEDPQWWTDPTRMKTLIAAFNYKDVQILPIYQYGDDYTNWLKLKNGYMFYSDNSMANTNYIRQKLSLEKSSQIAEDWVNSHKLPETEYNIEFGARIDKIL